MLSKLLLAFAGLAVIAQISCAKKTDDDGVPETLRDQALKAATESCTTFVKRLQGDFANVKGAFYDFITVPEDPSDPHGRQIKIFYYGRTVPGRTPVVFFNGGPAGNSHSSYVVLTLKQRMDENWAKIPFIFIDQRGTGCSDAYPQGDDNETLKRLTHYGTRGIVSDAEAIRARLGIKKWEIFGQSYGAFLIHRYVVMAPDSITSAHAHAGVITSDPIQRLLGRIRSQNRVIEAYLTDFPSDREVLTKLNQQLTRDVCFSRKGFNFWVCGLEVIEPFLGSIGFVDTWMSLHARFDLLLRDGGLDRARVQRMLNERVFTPAEKGRASGVASEVIGWNDRNVAEEDYPTCSKVFDLLRAEGAKPETWLFNECAATVQLGAGTQDQFGMRVRATLPQDLLTISDFKNTLASHPKLHFYLYSGAKDPYVPADDFGEELNAVGSMVRYTHFDGTGHDGFYDEAQVWEDLLAD